MSQTRRNLCIFYALVAVAALVATWSQNLQYMSGAATGSYLEDLKVTAASRSFTVDIGFLLLACVAVMVAEARRLKMGWTVWLYVVLGFVIAISVTFPLFLVAREMKLAKSGPVEGGLRFTVSDIIGLALVTGAVGYLTWFILS